MGKDLKTWWEEMKVDFTSYLQSRTELTKIQLYEKIARVVGVVISFIVLAFLVGFLLIFGLIMIGSWVAELSGSVAIGYSSVALLLTGLFIFLLVKRKSMLERPVTNRVIDALFDDEDEETDISGNNDPGKNDGYEK